MKTKLLKKLRKFTKDNVYLEPNGDVDVCIIRRLSEGNGLFKEYKYSYYSYTGWFSSDFDEEYCSFDSLPIALKCLDDARWKFMYALVQSRKLTSKRTKQKLKQQQKKREEREKYLRLF